MFSNQSKIIKHIFILVFVLGFFNLSSMILFDEVRLKVNAEDEGYGYKTANLMELENVIKNIEKDVKAEIRVKVPEFYGISSKVIKEFFKQNGLDIIARWNDVIREFERKDEAPLAILENLEARNNFILESEKLANDIENLNVAEKGELNTKLENFLTKAKRDNWRLMVRSTGREDTKELPNAGGNYSEPNVSPDLDSIIKAIKKVVGSYFREKSLMQRIDGGDKKIFEEPLTPVLLQRMIGELDEKNIPVGCVVYTRNPENKDEMTIIQAAFGHNEGVVTSSVNVDTFYVKRYEDETVIKKIMQVKNQRFIPIVSKNEFGLKLIENEDYLKTLPALNDDVIKEIDFIARSIEQYYKEAMDIELVYDQREKIIYLVQARPLQVRDIVSVSYIKDPDKISSENKILCRVVSASGRGIKHIISKRQVILAASLEKALNFYRAKQNKTEVSLVIVKGNAEATSHAAAIFRGVGKTILVVKDFERIRDWLEEEPVNLYLDTQRELIIKVKSGEIEFVPGWLKYPIPSIISITDEEAYIGPRKQISPEKSVEELLKDLETKEINEQLYKETISSIVDKLHTLVFEEQDLKRREQLGRIYAISTILEREIQYNLALKGLGSVELLYPVKFLESILLQLKDPKFVNVYSLKTILEERIKINKIKNELKNLFPDKEEEIKKLNEDILTIMVEGKTLSLTEDVGNDWIKFISSIVGLNGVKTDKKDTEKLEKLFEVLKKFEIIAMWINTSFALNYKNNPKEFLNASFQEIQGSSKSLEVLSQKRSWLLNVFDIEKFKDPKTFKKTFEIFKREIADFFL